MNGATMVSEGGIFKIVPQAAAVRGNVTPQLGTSNRALPTGFSVQIVPLRYVGVKEMLRLLEPFAKDAQAVRVDELRNLMILSGTERELRLPDRRRSTCSTSTGWRACRRACSCCRAPT